MCPVFLRVFDVWWTDYLCNKITYVSCVFALSFIFFFQKREIFDELAPLLWHSVGTTAAFLQVDLVSSYLQSKWFILVFSVLVKRSNHFQSLSFFFSGDHRSLPFPVSSNPDCCSVQQGLQCPCALSGVSFVFFLVEWQSVYSMCNLKVSNPPFLTSSVLLLILKRKCRSLEVLLFFLNNHKIFMADVSIYLFIYCWKSYVFNLNQNWFLIATFFSLFLIELFFWL